MNLLNWRLHDHENDPARKPDHWTGERPEETEPFGLQSMRRNSPRDLQHGDRRFIARQAIFDADQNVFGYELLCRSGWQNRFTGDSEVATRTMIADSALYGFAELTRGARCFVNCTRESLVEGLVTLLPKSTILEILETVTPDPEVVAAIKELRLQGYEIALDDFRMSDSMQPLIELAHYVKVDFRLSDAMERAAFLDEIRSRGLRLVAEKVETLEEFQIAKGEGFHFFQGYFFCHPTIFSRRRAPTNGGNYLRLLSALSHESFNVTQVTTLVRSEVAICYQLLRLVNSAAFALSHEVRSIQDAVILVGEDQFRRLVVNAIATETCRTRPHELLLHVLHRARFLELLAPYTGESPTEQYLFGLLSLMDVMLDLDLEDLVEVLPLRPELKAALLGEPNRITIGLHLLESYEKGEWARCEMQAEALQIAEPALTHIYQLSLRWAEKAAYTDPAPQPRTS